MIDCDTLLTRMLVLLRRHGDGQICGRNTFDGWMIMIWYDHGSYDARWKLLCWKHVKAETRRENKLLRDVNLNMPDGLN